MITTLFRYSVLGACVIGSVPQAMATEPTPSRFDELELSAVLDLEITSVSKKPQTLSRAAAAVFVITGDDIRRMGAQNLPDALRMAPGIQVAQVSANAWAVSARSTNGRFANKLLVLIDGRTVYSPLSSGVFWDIQDTVLADVERIEVIRGPGAAVWGANAVNGVINIITKSAFATPGALLEVSKGSQDRGTVSMRYGGEVQGVGHWRVYGKSLERNPYTLISGTTGWDDWRQQRAGWRADLTPSPRDAVTVQGELYQGNHGESSLVTRLVPPASTLLGTRQKVSGGHVLARWERELSQGNSLTVQSFLDQSDRDWPLHPRSRLETLDLDAQYRFREIKNHDIVMGAAYRQVKGQMQPSFTGVPADALQLISFDPRPVKTQMWSAMLQDDITLVPERVTLTLGGKVEKYLSDRPQVLPNARLLWTPKESQTFWAAASKAVRTPSLTDNNSTVRALLPQEFTFAGASLPRPAIIQVEGQFSSEKLWAYETGWKQRLAPGLTLDTSVFYNDYSNLRAASFDLNTMQCQPGNLPFLYCYGPAFPNQYLLLPSVLSNDFKGNSRGLEVWLDWQVSRQHRLQANATYLKTQLKSISGQSFSIDSMGSVPRRSSSVHWAYTPNRQVELDMSIRQVGAAPDVLFGQRIPGYSAMDMRWAWRSAPKVQWSVTGRNLLMSKHLEFISETGDTARTLIGPSVLLGLSLQF